MNKKSTLRVIDNVLTEITQQQQMAKDKSAVDELERILGYQIPEKTLSELFGLSSVVEKTGGEAISELFFGYEFLGIDGVLHQYHCFQDERRSIFGSYFCDENFNVPEKYQLWVDYELTREPTSPTVVRNLGAFLPMFSYQGDYVGEVIKPDSVLSGFIAIEAHHVSVVAPSLVEHLEDLKYGIDKGSYYFDDEDLCYSHAWCQRHEPLGN